MDQKTIYVHIGTYKTGTTSIQKSLAANRDKLMECGLHYLKAGLNNELKKHMGIHGPAISTKF
ncbi:hypothetical protein SAMN04488056_12339 [Cohaesibacter marisflavi]|uniref:Uncharacterized protein n=1 Tax=Cohaesibacter marisflavi TaxID=655353 RepID=A0A1I5MV73_9HYPH|nr:hypothetical protein SAMN04488056_12339 [Cohaesibacter marisflavi]